MKKYFRWIGYVGLALLILIGILYGVGQAYKPKLLVIINEKLKEGINGDIHIGKLREIHDGTEPDQERRTGARGLQRTAIPEMLSVTCLQCQRLKHTVDGKCQRQFHDEKRDEDNTGQDFHGARRENRPAS